MLGTVRELGRQLRIDASLYNMEAQLEERAEAMVEGLDALPSAVDTLVIQLIADLVAKPLEEIVSVAYRTTRNHEALKEYLKGEQATREYRGRDAQDAWRRAVAPGCLGDTSTWGSCGKAFKPIAPPLPSTTCGMPGPCTIP